LSGFHSFPVVDWFCLFIYLWVLTFPLLDCSPDLVQAFLKKWWVESDFKAPNLPLSLRLKVSGHHYDSIYNNTWTKQLSNQRQMSKTLLPPQYNWNIVESGVTINQPTNLLYSSLIVLILFSSYIMQQIVDFHLECSNLQWRIYVIFLYPFSSLEGLKFTISYLNFCIFFFF
jgi:hypothetical protein